ncbi:DnaD domain protein [Streptococcus suis]|uniref:DnaD domain protein n=2 Tax=Streptococcus suis TaxID=1307 RepID=UPI0005CD03D0|nr:DnaD domain protein [Streptococcus suis]MCB2915161.1 DnaD domain protein [Streptococcus suis]MCB2920979.1 DnaD domain protein [Streptococcus suis]MCQ8270485.1 DnaD domain protein [Streptococcus suis]MDW8659879.1 DnaD domain protein [Streptococcus suis]MDW8686895.1 DnaD domain protein [Streptococcus suis]
MAKTKIYFWLKIDKKFFDNIFIKRLKTIPGGYTMTVIYIRLMLESLESDCILYYEGYFENLKEELALKLDVSEDDIDMTMAYFTKCGLIQIDEDKNAELPQAKAMVMSETNWASYKREQRQNKERLDNVQKSLTNSNSCPTEIEIEIEKDIKKDIDINIELEVDNKKTATDTNIYDYYQQRIGSLDGYQYEKLKDYLDIDKLEPELVKRAIDRGADNSKRNFGYINKILKNWAQNGIRTIAQQDEEQRQFVDSKANKQKSNDWVPDPNYPPPY